MKAKEILKQAEEIQTELVALRRELHQNAEVGFRLDKTLSIVERELSNMGYMPVRCGKAGLTAQLQGAKKGKTILLRADMDGLPLQEKSGLPFACKNGNMHACGHDLHTTMLLGAARILKSREKELVGAVKFMFQPAEEILCGAADMIEHGVLTPKPDGAFMLHVLAGTELPKGAIVVSSGGASAPAVDFFSISVQGKGCHGAAPHEGIDPLTAAARLVLGLEQIVGKELPAGTPAVLTVGALQAGNTANVIPDRAEIKGTLRCFKPSVREFIKKRLLEIAEGVGTAYRVKVRVKFDSGAPALWNDETLSKYGLECATALFNADMVYSSGQFAKKSSGNIGGSEDFAYVAERVPSLMIGISSGTAKQGCKYPLHHPKAVFDEDILCLGSALYASLAYYYSTKTY
jgi:hippurate hydrolase